MDADASGVAGGECVYGEGNDGGRGKCHADVERDAEREYQYCGYCDALGPVWRDECPADLAAGWTVSCGAGASGRRFANATWWRTECGWKFRHSQRACGVRVVASRAECLFLDRYERF